MILDNGVLFSEDQTVTVTAGSTNSTDFHEERRLGTGQPLYVVVQLSETMASGGGTETVTVTVESDSVSNFASPAIVTTLNVFEAGSVSGTRRMGVLPPSVATERYLRVKYTVANGPLTAGKFTAFITTSVDAYNSYPDAVTISQ